MGDVYRTFAECTILTDFLPNWILEVGKQLD